MLSHHFALLMVRPQVDWLKENFAYTMARRQVPDSRHHDRERLRQTRSQEFHAIPSAIPSFFVAGNLQPQIRILIPRYSSCESCGTGFCVAIIAGEGASFQKPRFRSLDPTLKGQKAAKSGHF